MIFGQVAPVRNGKRLSVRSKDEKLGNKIGIALLLTSGCNALDLDGDVREVTDGHRDPPSKQRTSLLGPVSVRANG